MKAHRFTQAVFTILLLVTLLIGFIPLKNVYAVAPDPLTWELTDNSMHVARTNQTATLLLDGKVLVAGGLSGSALSTAEIFDPGSDSSAGTWTYTGQMHSARSSHTATLLADGKVLVVGGFNGSNNPLATAELYDPETHGWTETSNSMSTSRYFHTATLLANGQVLVTGGVVGKDSQNHAIISKSAELYDPQTNSWTATGSMNTKRIFHTATLLPNGKVLVVGGNTSESAPTGALKTSELYDPTTGTWQMVSHDLSTPRYMHTATMLSNGEVLIAGGGNSDINVHGFPTVTELYDYTTDQWTTSGDLNVGRYQHTATLIGFTDGRELVLVAGGRTYSPTGSVLLDSAELYDPDTGLWDGDSAEPMKTPRATFTATQLLDSQVLAVGGSGASGSLLTAELYNPTIPGSAPAKPVLISPTGNTNTEVSYLWHTSDGATSYQLQVQRTSPSSTVLDTFVTHLFCNAGICTYHPANPLAAGSYQFRVQAKNIAGFSGWSDWLTFIANSNSTISGNAGTAGVTLTYFDVKLRTVTADASGNYSLPVSYDWSGKVTPSLDRYIFTPAFRDYSHVMTDSAGQNYVAVPLRLTVTPAGNGSGTVTSAPTGINCGADCEEIYSYNTSVTLTAAPAISSNFTGWGGSDCSGTGTCTVAMTDARNVTATFTLKTFTVTVSPSPANGKVTSSPTGIDCGADCSEIYNYGTELTLTGVENTGYALASWDDDYCSDFGISDCTMEVTSDMSVSATFTVGRVLTLTISGNGSGIVTSSPAKMNCSANCSPAFPLNTVVVLTANPDSGSYFNGWGGGLCTGKGTCTVTMSAARSVTAEFISYHKVFLPLVVR
jgi:hypothetical protein